MHWASILFVLVLTLASAALVLLADWSVPQAFVSVALGGIAFVVVLLGILLILAPPEGRRPLLVEAWRTFRQDVQDFQAWITGRK